MSGGKETPRQKMIGMMYLVLTALLALNVSKDVLDAFILVDEGLTKTTTNFVAKNQSLYGSFNEAYELNPAKVEEWILKAREVREKSQSLYDFLHESKKEIVIRSEGAGTDAIVDNTIDMRKVKGKDNNNVPAEIMILNGKGKEVRQQMADYREYLVSLIDDKENYGAIVSSLQSGLNTEDPPPDKKGVAHSWESYYFEHLPLASVITLLSKMQSDVRNAESEIINYLLSQIDAGSFKFNKIEPVIIANSDYVFKGQEYKARVYLAASDSTKDPEILVGEQRLPIEGGKGVFTGNTSTVGTKSWSGVIRLVGDDGSAIVREFKHEYTVAEASAVVSPTKMNVFYRGVDNPVSISVSGVPKENLEVEITKGSIRRATGGDWVVKPSQGNEGEVVSVRVFATIDRVRRFMGASDFRVKDVPDPVAEVAGKSQGVINLGDLTRATGVSAELKNFDFDLDFQITEFTVSAVLSGGFTKTERSENDRFTRAQMEIVSQLRSGQRITFENVKAIGPDGKIRTLNSIVLRIN
jgi:gliding motility-associated protein GldM